MRWRSLAEWAVVVCLLAGGVEALYEGMYCGKQNCYDVLGVDSNASKKDIARVYRKLQRDRHPDKNPEAMRDPKKHQRLQEEWHRIRIAYETLKDDASRQNYDYLLANPDEFFRHWWYYHRTRVSQQVNVWGVVFALLTVISVGQYYLTNWSYWHNLSAILAVDDKILRHYVRRAEDDGHMEKVKNPKGKDLPRAQQKEAVLLLYGEEMAMEANLNFCKWSEVLWCSVLTYPLWLPQTMERWVRWYHRRWRGEPYNDEERAIMTMHALYVSRKVWAHYGPEHQQYLMEQELWVPENLAAYKEEQDEIAMSHYLSSAEMKRYKKMKKRQ